MPAFTPADLLQVLILALGIYLVLCLLRTARGSGLARGLGLGVLVVGMTLYGLTNAFNLRELQQVLDAIFGVATIVLAILFQPELRRGIMGLGDHQLFGRFLANHAPEAVDQVCEAAIEMARKRQGALIAFERKVPLDTYVDAGARIEAPVSAELLDSIFHPGAALHDGAVVVRDGKVAAAAVLFPLSENSDLSKSTGTRHRAALGLTELTDAVAVIVSEETGSMSICTDGKMERRIARERFCEVLHERLGLAGSSTPERDGFGSVLRDMLSANLGQKAIALALGIALFFVASNQVTETREYFVRLVPRQDQRVDGPTKEELQVMAPPAEGPIVRKVFHNGGSRRYGVTVVGPREEMQQLDGIGGVFALKRGVQGELVLDAEAIRWGSGRYASELQVAWSEKGPDAAPRVNVRPFAEHLVTLDVDAVPIREDALGERYKLESVTFRPSDARVLVPSSAGTPMELLQFQELVPTTAQKGAWSVKLALTEELIDAGYELLDDVFVEGNILPRLEDLGTIDREVVLLSFNPEMRDAGDLFEPPTTTARLRLRATNLISPELGLVGDLGVTLRLIAAEHARVYVDVSRMATDGSRSAPIEVDPIPKEVWEAALRKELDRQIELDDDAEITIELSMDDPTVVLEPKQSSESQKAESPQTEDEES